MNIVINFNSENFSILGDTWMARLGVWHHVPKGPLILHAKLDCLLYPGDGEVELPALLDQEGTLHVEGMKFKQPEEKLNHARS